MSRILFSWIAYNHDFKSLESGHIIFNPDGTHGDCYKHGIFKYKEHILLSKASKKGEDNRFERVVEGVKPYANKITPCYLNIAKEDVINVEVLVKSLEKELSKYSKDDLEAYISPGTPAMQTAWYLLASKFSNLKLFQVNPPKFRNGKPPEKKQVRIIRTEIPSKLNYYHHAVRKIDNEKDSKILVTKSMKHFYYRAKKIALTHDVTTLIKGETGTGKEYVAKYIHNQSAGRSKRNIVTINCAQLNNELLESRLFGTVNGAFTDAKDTLGAFRQANHSTLFLDEIGDISPKMQQTLLRVLETKVVSPVGDFSKKYKVNVRVIAATHKKLDKLVETGDFRRDLFHRLNIADIETIPYRMLPPQEKRELFEFINEQMRVKYRIPKHRKITFSKNALQCIENYPFFGNLRELSNLIERLFIFCDSEVSFDNLPNKIKYPKVSRTSLKLKDVKERHILMVYKMYGEDFKKAAEILGEGASHNVIRRIVEEQKNKESI